MKVKALVSFAGSIAMYAGEEREVSDKALLDDLLGAKYIEEVKKPAKKAVKASESK